MAMWKKHRFLSLDKEDDVDKVLAGEQFIVRYIGSTYFNEFEKREKPLIEFYCNLLKNIPSKTCAVLRLIVDLSGAMLYDKQGNVSHRFELGNISDAIYCNKIPEYSCYFVLVGQEQSERCVKAHVFVCENKKKAKVLYETFMQAFALGAEIKSFKRQASVTEPYLSSTVAKGYRNNNKSKNVSTAGANACDMEISNHNNTSTKPQCYYPPTITDVKDAPSAQRQGEPDLEESFTELARSRQQSSLAFNESRD